MLVRLARLEDAAALPPIEHSAGQLFKNAPGLAWLAEGDVMALQEHERLIAQGTVWLAQTKAGQPVGFASAEVFDDELHLWELSVHADWQRKGVGKLLMHSACTHASAKGLAALTLTTFSDIAWNAPAYARLGFQPASPLGERLRNVLADEVAHGLPATRRVAMRRWV